MEELMQKAMERSILGIVVFALLLIGTVQIFVLPEAHAFAVHALNEVSVPEAHYAQLLSTAEGKRDWVEAEMSGEQGFLQTESLRIETRELKRIHTEYAESFNTRYTIFKGLGLI